MIRKAVPRLSTGLFWGLLAAMMWTAGVQTSMAENAGLVSGDALLAATKGRIRDIDRAALEGMLKKHRHMALIDVRTRREVNLVGGTIGAHQNNIIPRGWLEFRVKDAIADKNTPIVVYCGTNQRSPLAAKTLMEMGYTNVANYAGGFFEWRKAGLPVERFDEAPGTALFSRPVKVTDGVWSAIGALAPGTYENNGHNNNLSFIVTSEGVVVVNAGDNYLLAAALHDEIRKVTKQPVKYVILENGQGHAAMGSSYWRAQGAKIIAHKDAASELAAHGTDKLERIRRRLKDKAYGTDVPKVDIAFDKEHIIELGGMRIEARYLGPSHSPGDIVTWLPQKKLVISGDMAFHQRLLPVFEDTDTAAWLSSWKAFEALGAMIVIPGHGEATDMAQVTKTTVGYLTFLRGKVGELIENGGDLKAAYLIDQSPYKHLATFRQLAKRNAGRVFRSMEFE